MRLRALAAIVGLVAAACGGGGEVGAALPSGDHLHSLAVTPGGELLLGLHGGLYRSADGEAWDSAGLQGEDAMVITSGEERMFVAGHEVLYRSDDGGETFTPLRPADLPGLDIHAFAQAAGSGAAVYAFVVGHGLFSSADGGETWELSAPLEQLPRDLFGLAVTGSESETLVLVGPDSGIHRSPDGGRTLTRVAETPTWAVAVDPGELDRVWSLAGSGLLLSDDAGQSWKQVSALTDLDGQPASLAVGSNGLWVITEEPRALYRSGDQGATWERIAGT
jgi:photosystem II stability/assembly factor-like uncharacterized protein